MISRLLPLALAGLLLACGASDATGPADAEPGATASVPSRSTETRPPDSPAGSAATTTAGSPAGTDVPEALRFSAPLVGGGDIELTTLAGRPVLLWFWAPW